MTGLLHRDTTAVEDFARLLYYTGQPSLCLFSRKDILRQIVKSIHWQSMKIKNILWYVSPGLICYVIEFIFLLRIRSLVI